MHGTFQKGKRTSVQHQPWSMTVSIEAPLSGLTGVHSLPAERAAAMTVVRGAGL